MIRPRSKDAIGREGQTDPEKIRIIKDEIVKTHDMLKAEGSSIALRAIARAMPFWVSERLLTELRSDLILEGRLPPNKHVNPNAAEHGMKRMPVVTLEEMRAEMSEIQNAHFRMMGCRAEKPVQPDITRWAIKSYKTAWRSIRELLADRNTEMAPHEPEQAPESALAGALQVEAARPRHGHGLRPISPCPSRLWSKEAG